MPRHSSRDGFFRNRNDTDSHISALRDLYEQANEAWRPVAAGTWTSLYVAEGGSLMQCGFAINSLNISEAEVNPIPTAMPSMVGIRMRAVSSVSGFSAAISSDWVLYTWGICTDGRLGHGVDVYSVVPMKVLALSEFQIQSVALGFRHCIAVTNMGGVFSWGINTHGQCGHGMKSAIVQTPQSVLALVDIRVRNASAGRAHSLVVTKEGVVYSFGCGRFGQLGYNSDIECSPNILMGLSTEHTIASTATGKNHSLALTIEGKVYAWGIRGQHIAAYSPRAVDTQTLGFESYTVQVAAGGDSSCVVSNAGLLATWGSGESGMLGHGDDDNKDSPVVVNTLRELKQRVIAVSMSLISTVAVTADGSVFGWGNPTSLGKQVPRGITKPLKLDVRCSLELQ